jgi:hypothetical protein
LATLFTFLPSTLPQTEIQAWIERIPRHIQEIIRLKAGNETLKAEKHSSIIKLARDRRANCHYIGT